MVDAQTQTKQLLWWWEVLRRGQMEERCARRRKAPDIEGTTAEEREKREAIDCPKLMRWFSKSPL